MSSLLYRALRYIWVNRRLPGIESFRSRRGVRMPGPEEIQIEPTTLCNLNCATCTHDQLPEGRRRASLSLERFQSIIRQMPSVRRVKLQGLGEPLMAPDFRKMLEWGQSQGLWFDIISNGTLAVTRMTEVLPLLGRFIVSFDAVSQPVMDKIRAGVSVDRLKSAVCALVEEKRRRKLDVSLGISCVVSHINCYDVKGILDFGKEAGVDLVSFVAVENWLTPGEKDCEESKAFARLAHEHADFNRIQKMYDEGGYPYALHLLDQTPRKGHCFWSFTRAFITCDGFVTPCCIRPHPEVLNFGNVFEEPFSAIWNGPKMREFRRCHLGHTPLAVCDNCPL